MDFSLRLYRATPSQSLHRGPKQFFNCLHGQKEFLLVFGESDEAVPPIEGSRLFVFRLDEYAKGGNRLRSQKALPQSLQQYQFTHALSLLGGIYCHSSQERNPHRVVPSGFLSNFRRQLFEPDMPR